MQADDLIGTMLGNYRILAKLGEGGMARVYKAHQENLDREVAVKVLPPWFAADPNFVERFKQEARLVGRLSHPNIVTVHDASEQHGHLYIVMQLVDGGTLKHRLEKLQKEGKTLDITEALPIFTQLASALTYAHQQGIIHRDIKPVNVLLDRSGRAILSDFGIAKVMMASANLDLTRPGAGVGTPEYMSPEQCQGTAVDQRADIYALGVMLFEALTGRTPFRGNNYAILAHNHLYELPPRPSLINPAIPPAVERVIFTALMKHPQQRYQSAEDMADALGRAVNAQAPKKNYFGLSPAASLIRPTPAVTAENRQGPLYACHYCQHPNKASMFFCTHCGKPLSQCPQCSKQNPVKNRFCTTCGCALNIYVQ